MPILVGDANILIDLDVGGLIEKAFQLPERIEVPDLLFADELAEDHPDLVDRGLDLGELDANTVTDLMALNSRYAGLSRYDCAALALARQYDCTLVTGDSRLRQAAEAESVSVHGTIWLVERMLDEHLMSVDEARVGFAAMRHAGRRLPWAEAKEMLQSRAT